MTENSNFVVVSIVQGGLTANILKSHRTSDIEDITGKQRPDRAGEKKQCLKLMA